MSSFGLIHLSSNNFTLEKTKNGVFLCNSIKGFSVVLFYSLQKCKYSAQALNEFRKVVGSVNGVVFAALDVDKYLDVVRLSRNSATVIEGVPYMMLYYNGIPQQIYPDEYPFLAPDIKQFSATVATNIYNAIKNSEKQQASTSQAKQQSASKPSKVSKTIYYISSPLKKRQNITYLV
jgi:hypothetical protein